MTALPYNHPFGGGAGMDTTGGRMPGFNFPHVGQPGGGGVIANRLSNALNNPMTHIGLGLMQSSQPYLSEIGNAPQNRGLGAGLATGLGSWQQHQQLQGLQAREGLALQMQLEQFRQKQAERARQQAARQQITSLIANRQPSDGVGPAQPMPYDDIIAAALGGDLPNVANQFTQARMQEERFGQESGAAELKRQHELERDKKQHELELKEIEQRGEWQMRVEQARIEADKAKGTPYEYPQLERTIHALNERVIDPNLTAAQREAYADELIRTRDRAEYLARGPEWVAEQERVKARVKAQESLRASLVQTKPKAEAAFSEYERAIEATLEDLADAESKVDWDTSGLTGAALALIPGTPAYDLKKQLEGVLGRTAYQASTRYRAQSETGGFSGQLTEKEIMLLSYDLGAINQATSKPELLKAMQIYQSRARELVRLAKERHEAKYRGVESAGEFLGQGTPGGRTMDVPEGGLPRSMPEVRPDAPTTQIGRAKVTRVD